MSPSRANAIGCPSGDHVGCVSFVLRRREPPRPGAVGVHDVDVERTRRACSRTRSCARRATMRARSGRRDRRATTRRPRRRVSRCCAPAVGVHLEDRVVAVPSAHEREIGPRHLVATAAARGQQRPRRAAATSEETSDVHRVGRSRASLVSQRLDAEVPALQLGVVGRAPPPSSRRRSRPPTMTSWRSASDVATPRFCSMRRIARPSSSRSSNVSIRALDDGRSEALGRLVHDEESSDS